MKVILLLVSVWGYNFICNAIPVRNIESTIDYPVEQWNVIEVTFRSSKSYKDPFEQIELTAVFYSPNGTKISRPGFWDGHEQWKVRFAPTEIGEWKMITICSDSINPGLHGIVGKINCIPYKGELAIYKNGFLKVSKTGRYFAYDNERPFFYLGDTHWLFIHERFYNSNVKGIPSQFKFSVDKRVDQGFTVYQSEAIQEPHGPQENGKFNREPYCDFSNGVDEGDIAGLRNIDRKFKYIAEKGLVNANSAVCWALDPLKYRDGYTEGYMMKLGRYWAARYGAYPVLWTIAQEIDRSMYDQYDSITIRKWFALANGIDLNDDYNHPLTAHMENTSHTLASTSWWGKKSYHDWWAIQWQEGINSNIISIAKDFWNSKVNKPSVLYESAYEGFWTDARGAVGAAYKAFQSGIFGYGYGANGVWNNLYSKNPPDYGTGYEMPARYLNWFDGLNLEGAKQLASFKKFYDLIDWWELEPRFDDPIWSEFADKSQSLLSTIGQNTYVVFFYNKVNATGVLKNLRKNSVYLAKWYNPRKGVFTTIAEFKTKDGEWVVPNKPDDQDWVLIVESLVRKLKSEE